MAGKAQELGGLVRVADYLSLELLARLVPLENPDFVILRGAVRRSRGIQTPR
jgi:hypothetical protein